MTRLSRRLKLIRPQLTSAPLITDVDPNWEVLDDALLLGNNLSDVASIGTSRGNLKVPMLASSVVAVTTNVTSRTGYKPTLNGVAVDAGGQVLLTGQTTASQNGPWLIPTVPGAAWTRPTDFASGSKVGARFVGVTGDTGGVQLWMLQTSSVITVDTDAQVWVRLDIGALTKAMLVATGLAASDLGAIASSRQVIAGTGLTGGGDLSADRTLAVSYGTTSTTAAAGNDSRITGSQPIVESVNTQSAVTGTYTIPAVTTATMHKLTLTGNTTFTFPTMSAGSSFTVWFIQDATGGRTITLPTVKTPSGTALTFSTTAGYIDVVTFATPDGTNIYAFPAGVAFA